MFPGSRVVPSGPFYFRVPFFLLNSREKGYPCYQGDSGEPWFHGSAFRVCSDLGSVDPRAFGFEVLSFRGLIPSETRAPSPLNPELELRLGFRV